MRWTEEQYMDYLKKRGRDKYLKKDGTKNIYTPKKRSKYNNKKTVVDGIVFDSKKEARYYDALKLLQQAGEVTKIELQPKFELLPTFKKNGVTHRAITYIADFKVTYADGKVEIVDVKGIETQVFKIKQKLFEYKYPKLSLKVVKDV